MRFLLRKNRLQARPQVFFLVQDRDDDAYERSHLLPQQIRVKPGAARLG